MRARTVLLVLAILLMAGFAAQNWAEFTRPSMLTFGVVERTAPLGVVLLVVLAAVTLAFVATAAAMHTRSLTETRHHARALNAQRELAEKAEASRFTDLRQVLDSHLREVRQRESIQHSEMERVLSRQHRELRDHLEQVAHALTARITEMEQRLDTRRMQAAVPPVDTTRTVAPTRAAEPVHMQPGRDPRL
jgi:hypothetical protein